MQVKDYLQALSDEGKIRVEKIGSGNWYWSFAGEERRAREGVLERLGEEKKKVEVSVEELRGRLEEMERARGDGEENVESERERLMEREEVLKGEVDLLRAELMGFSENDPDEVERKRVDVETFRQATARWTDNIYILEGYLGKLTGGDKEAVEAVRTMFYGSEHVEGEGLKEL